ncbi:hypothetical protein IC582_002765 [Cucumis melo]
MVDMWVLWPSAWKLLDKPKSASLAWKFSVSKMFVVFTSLWIIGGLHPSCRSDISLQSNVKSTRSGNLHRKFNNFFI